MAVFTGDAAFGSTTFAGDAWFRSAFFGGTAGFGAVTFGGDAWFRGAEFRRDAGFGSADFTRGAVFESVTFAGDVVFDRANFSGTSEFMSAVFAGTAWFYSATFGGDAVFELATFDEPAMFDSATFTTDAWFVSADFNGDAVFVSATFNGRAGFRRTTFNRDAMFASAVFAGEARFYSAAFRGTAGFVSAVFAGDASFGSASFRGTVDFRSATFKKEPLLGPLVCEGTVDLSGASFTSPISVVVAARRVEFQRTRWEQKATVSLRYAEADLTDAVCEYPLVIVGTQRPFVTDSATAVDESVLAGVPERARVLSLRGVDAAHVVLTDMDLSACLFAGTIHLDQLRLEGDCVFAPAPSGIHQRGRLLPLRHARRRTLAEEQHWRATGPGANPGWLAAPPSAEVVQPSTLAAVYRALRKAYEDSSYEPGAADFYYGEMEMRRADSGAGKAERGLLTAYWALSGYGLRAARALGWLLAAVAVTMLVMMLWGLPRQGTPALSTGTVIGHRITLTTDDPAPANPQGPLTRRLTSERFEKSLRVVVNSVIFRSSGQDLTTTGTYTEMASRLTEPVLLGLAALALRSRIKR
ncbi:pentapeptide repeat-containing protein [Streptomyces sp. NPDC051976]|uniref:pentapeptide repeat-containing protein n=1 Tax=Streptomyces sp. NPDC051976 TaxID=3154947 RepID=UPI003436D2BD